MPTTVVEWIPPGIKTIWETKVNHTQEARGLKIIRCKGVPYKRQRIRPKSGRDGYRNGRESATKHIYHSQRIEPRNIKHLVNSILGEPASVDHVKCAGMCPGRTKISLAVSEAQYDYINNTN